MTESKFELVDRASGKNSELPVRSGTIGPSVVEIASLYKDHDAFTYDPGFGVTAACESKITYIDGDAGVLLYHDSMDIYNPRHREIFAHRIVAKIPTIAAAAHKHSLGQPFIYPRNDLDYCSNMLHMFFAVPCEPYQVDPIASQALDLLFVLHA